MQKAIQVARFGVAKLRVRYARFEKYVPAASFLGGVLFDVLTTGRIDKAANLLQLGGYLLVVWILLALEILDLNDALKVPARLAKAWHYRDEAAHFVLGSLLSAFTIFFFKASSIWGSAAFFALIVACLVGNEFPGLRSLGVSVRTVLFGVCLTSYLVCVVPIAWGHVGFWPFATALTASLAAAAGFVGLLARRLRRGTDADGRIARRGWLLKRVFYPYAGLIATFLALYLCHLIPPVPLSLKHIGIYHDVERVSGGYKLTHTRPAWRFWETGDQRFRARPGDRIYCFFSIFSPGGFSDSIRVRWLFKDPRRGWQGRDAVPVAITGGREQGFRGFAFKSNYQPGDWQVRIETSDELEIGRIYLSVEETPGDAAADTAVEELI